ncbi:PilC/PilY family type IV pilus protein [Endozoicomonas gorgoniicola]|uniref:PilC/PilY family type IV pilus protein n=1 Tax=Endozoicomonas gorgoniicola TaxID=1234144 RepID=A0ABT3MWS6_9GAMM|nr:PilC/PilY family type IV pilus protein [Endozoicomonas gorgoniicola]MCW7553832.1 PilC/PilY family type IV pilus protein [Endozoicomonas gorgoniicola]
MNRLSGIVLFIICFCYSGQHTLLASSSHYTFGPIQGSSRGIPQLMLALSFDHELFKKVYDDYTDIDGDGIMDVTYMDTFEYSGYFEPDWCYSHSLGRFRPVAQATGTNGHSCNGTTWSGNFMNWGTMSRIDLLRKLIYGGMRSTDTASLTVLERAEIPNDWHAFNKVYEPQAGDPSLSDLTPYTGTAIAMCNATTTSLGTPFVRIRTTSLTNPYQTDPTWIDTVDEWAGGDSLTCGNNALAQLEVRIEACHSTSTSNDCLNYGSSRKPIGLIQRRQDDVHFGLITGSFDANISGGVVRKNIGSAADEIDQSTGQFILNNGIVANIDRLRIAEYPYGLGFMSCGGSGPSGCTPVWSVQGLSFRCRTEPLPCRDWGNPISEIYLEALRYFSGQTTPSSEYSTGTDLGLSKPAWQDPLSVTNACSNCSILLLSTGQNSYDDDNYNNLSDVISGGLTQLQTLTDQIGTLEPDLSFPGNYVIGEVAGVTGVRQCLPRTLPRLSLARGICPEAPLMEGSYYLSGLSHFAFNNDLRSGLSGSQTINTYVVELAKSIPALNFAVPISGGQTRTVSLTPICQASNGATTTYESEFFPCSFLKMQVRNFTVDTNGALTSISFRILWQDFPWGGDGDADASAVYTVNVSNNNFQVEISDPVSRAAYSLRIGYSLTGVNGYNGLVTDADYNSDYKGFLSGYDDADAESAMIIWQGGLLEGFLNFPCSGTGCQSWATPLTVTKNFTPSANFSESLPSPLILAAKYSSFNDLDNDGTPNFDGDGDGVPDDDSREWDNVNNVSGVQVPDGIPDNYFFSDNPNRLNEQLNELLENLAGTVSSSSAPVVTTDPEGSRSVVQALFSANETVNNLTVSWVGWLYSLFIDERGHLREDANSNRTLDDYSVDPVVTLNFNAASGNTTVQRWNSTDNGITLTPNGNTVSIDDLDTLWDARNELSDLSNLLTQRSYTSATSNGRHILTWLDDNNNSTVDTGELHAFTSSLFSGAREGYLGNPTAGVTSLINYIRGQEQTGLRSRSVDFDNDGTTEVWRLGDIVNSSPVKVGTPRGSYTGGDTFNPLDETFERFRQHYANRREVIYVGANDGMLHAFNGGFWNETSSRFELTFSGSGTTSHPLGGELWAYIPMNLLPHLQWLTENNYPHVPYMDGKLQVFDANVFPNDTDHPNGWGTILVAAMGMGGGPIDVTVSGSSRTMRSSYVVMDITNPEKPPVLMAEISAPNLGFTLTPPVLVRQRRPDNNGDFDTPAQNDWYLVFGSGPIGTGVTGTEQALANGTSNQSMRVYVYDLESKDFVTPFNPMVTSIPNAYSGEMVVADWERDGYDDTIYFGSVRTTGNLSGELLRLNLSGTTPAGWGLSTLTNPQRPVTAAPLVLRSTDNHRWVYTGTGRDLVINDRNSAQQEYYFGVKEPRSGNTFTGTEITFSDLTDTTDVDVQANGTLGSTFSVSPGVTAGNFDALATAINNGSGWVNRLATNGTMPDNKSVSPGTSTQGLIFFVEYSPPTNQCSIVDSSFLNGVFFQTGTAFPAAERQVFTQAGFSDTDISVKRISLGAGKFTKPQLAITPEGDVRIITQGGAGNISTVDLTLPVADSGRQSWRRILDIPLAP